jgi:O-antigen/teichoic acid export membrane protein
LKIKEVRRYDSTIMHLIAFATLGYLLKYLLNVVLARYLTPSLYGDFNIAIRVLTIIMTCVLLGTHHSAKRFFSSYWNAKDEVNCQKYIDWNIKTVSFSILICVFIAASSFIVMHVLHYLHIKDIRSYHLTIYMLWIAPLASIFTLLRSYLVCEDHLVFQQALRNIKKLMYIIFILVMFEFFKVPTDNYMLAIIVFLSFALLILVELVFISKRTPLLYKSLLRAFPVKFNYHGNQEWKSVSFRLALSSLIFLLVCVTDLIIVEVISPDRNAVGMYAVALTIASSILVIPTNIYSSVKVIINRLSHTNKGRQQIELFIRQLNRVSLCTMLVLAGLIFSFSKLLLLHFGTVYAEAEPALRILVVAFMLIAYSKSAAVVLTYSDHEADLLKISAVDLALLIVLGIILTYYDGIVGTAIATTISVGVKFIVLNISVYRRLKIKTFVV